MALFLCSSGVFFYRTLFRIQCRWLNGLAISDLATSPAARCPLFGLLQHTLTLSQNGNILASMPLLRCDEAQFAVLVLDVVSGHEATYPAPCITDAFKTRCRPLWTIFQRLEQRFREGVV